MSLSRNKTLVLIFFIIIIIPILLFTFNPSLKNVFTKTLSATLEINKPTIVSNGPQPIPKQLSKEAKVSVLKTIKNRAIITIKYTNNSARTLRNVKIKFEENNSKDPTNFRVFGGQYVYSYSQSGQSSIILAVPDAEPNKTKFAKLYIWAEHAGSGNFTATVNAEGFSIKTNKIVVTAL